MRTSLVNRRRQKRRGFTLIEILLVLGILVVLGSIVGVSVLQMQATAYERAAKNQLNQLSSACTAYQLDVGMPPSTLEGLVNAPDDVPEGKWKGPYLQKGVVPVDPWDQQYNYEPNGENYTITSNGKDRVSGTQDDIRL
ncbi:type II secretion system major pseudopilin GspG [Anatilimnocola floriformis]|uniref:type II secretion system major pseudopilin GspG n=1 Tax=Anatilimnocola floriformis TaxID=2948575 RepID=UPI0020C2B9FA|nr:type II secretion system major pseudopilin GspG [Anatilimnocola floriformis]